MRARRLLPITRRGFGRHTPQEIREMADGAQWRAMRAEDRRAGHTAHLMNATGNFAKDKLGNERPPLTAADILGRAPLSPDPLAPVDQQARQDDERRRLTETLPPHMANLTPEERQEKASRAMSMLAQANAAREAGIRSPEPS
jgi:hypothetical protein